MPAENEITVESGDWRQTVALKPNEERVIAIPVDEDLGGTLVRLRTNKGVRPSDLDPSNGDHRKLGAWIRFE